MRNICLSILFFCGMFSATAQPKFGVTGGYILSTLIDGDDRTFKSEELNAKLYSQSSVYAGLYVDNPQNEKLSMRYELNYVVAGAC